MENNQPIFTLQNSLSIINLTPEGTLDEKRKDRVDNVSPTSGGLSLTSQSSIATLTSLNTEPDLPSLAKPEQWWNTCIQVGLPFFVAGIGTIGAGLVLGTVQVWDVFRNISALFILVPSLLGLKGNLDMCLASRLSTQANLGKMTSTREICIMVIGNLALVQVQATVAAFLVSIFAVAVNSITDGGFNFNHALLLSASSITTATCSCFTLDIVLVFVILVTHHYHINPDNIATPLAASIGDVVSISLLANIATLFYNIHDTMVWVPILVVIIYIMLLPFWVWLVYRNKYTRPVLKSGWVPVLSALLISGLGGLVLDTVVDIYKYFVVFQPIINGIGGNLVSVQASRISTMLHQTSLIGIIPPHTKLCANPFAALFKGLPHAKTSRILIALSLIGQTCFIFIADYMHSSRTTLRVEFVFSYLIVSTLQVMLLLYLAHVFIHCMWIRKIDPDNSAIPILTSIGDFTGSAFLALAFFFLSSINRPYEG